MKTGLRAKQEALEELWRQGLSGQTLLEDHSRLVDEFISDCYLSVESKNRKVAYSVTLVALGGYGRQELFPYSDIDLMILYRPRFKHKIGEVADEILYPLWDTGMEVGHGVRTVKESIRQGREDFFFQVAMADARLIVGSQDLFDDLLVACRKNFIEGHRREFVKTMQLFRGERRKRFGAHSYLLEPHIKEGKGGLRDIQAMLWTAKVVFGLSRLSDIVTAGILLVDEAKEFSQSWNMLVKIRNRLHYISRRKNDQLYFEQQEEMAEAFDYIPVKGVLRVEKFMRELYGHLQTIAVTTDLFFEHVDEVLGQAGKGEVSVADKVLEQGLEIRNNRVCLTETVGNLPLKPQLLMRIFLMSARTGVPVHHRTRKAVSANLYLLSEKNRSSGRLLRPFLEILTNGLDVLAVLEAMLETGILTAYIPEFSRITTLAQHDLYHIFTVDRHSLQAVAELRRVVDEESVIFENVNSSAILYFATLLHDIGKGAGGDHSRIGAELAGEIGERVGFSEDECETLSFLIRYHLFLPENALRRDLSDEMFISRCADIIGNTDRLAMLYLISVADSKATGPSAWSDWKGSLLMEMYLQVHSRLEGELEGEHDKLAVPGQEEQGVAWLRDRVSRLLVGEEVVMKVDDLADDYLTSFTPEVVAGHLLIHTENQKLLSQKTYVSGKKQNNQYSLLIMSMDRPGLLAKICGVLTLHNLTVLNAQIFTWIDGTVVDVIGVRGFEGAEFGEDKWQSLNRDLDLAIAHRLGLAYRLYQKLSRSYGHRKEPVARYESRVVIDNEISGKYTVIEVYSEDQPGRLYNITQTLTDFGINISKAFIATEVEQLIDVFYVLDNDGGKIKDKEFQDEIRKGLLYSIEKS